MLPANATLRTQVSQLALEISATRTRLAEMQAELVSLQHRLDTVTYPVLSLPPEIVAEIFIHCLSPTPEWPGCIHSEEAPLLLSRICSHWRGIALATPVAAPRYRLETPRETSG
ncbi:hypothetical protein FB45DRAFT_905250 [Roridomyces roridus]|uniref:F-box domain-containing protein n=1 Tax=Roridomyces roridus TaxID=1738132 RepID=A0AAD7FRZ5_9AGAR|nr:hypothetical protein FB45DRAFT_905250 [Roridomyces roridus]